MTLTVEAWAGLLPDSGRPGRRLERCICDRLDSHSSSLGTSVKAEGRRSHLKESAVRKPALVAFAPEHEQVGQHRGLLCPPAAVAGPEGPWLT